jgi:hypothetical protein
MANRGGQIPCKKRGPNRRPAFVRHGPGGLLLLRTFVPAELPRTTLCGRENTSGAVLVPPADAISRRKVFSDESVEALVPQGPRRQLVEERRENSGRATMRREQIVSLPRFQTTALRQTEAQAWNLPAVVAKPRENACHRSNRVDRQAESALTHWCRTSFAER